MSEVAEYVDASPFADLERVANIPAGSITLVGLRLVDPEMPYEAWEQLGRGLGNVRRWASWAIGDWYNFGEAVYGQEASQATEATRADRIDILTRVTGLNPATLANYASICGRIAMSRRRVELDFGVHEPVAALEPDEQTEWLQRAVDEGWGREELRQAIRDSKQPPSPEPQVVDDPLGDHLTVGERIEQAARLVFHQGQPSGDGNIVVPPEPWSQLAAALGEE